MSPQDSSSPGTGVIETRTGGTKQEAQSGLESLGEALAGVTIGGASKAASSNYAGSSSIPVPFAIAPGAPRDKNDGWGNFVTPAALEEVSTATLENGAGLHSRNESLELFLSQSPSQTLGDDVFKFSHTNLPALAEEERPTGMPEDTFRMPPAASSSFGEIHRPQENGRRRSMESQSASMPGTTSSSRTGSPSGKNGDAANGRTMQAFNGRFDARRSGEISMVPHHQGAHPMDLPQRSPYGKDPNQFRSNLSGNAVYDHHGNYDSRPSGASAYKQTMDPSPHQLPPMMSSGGTNCAGQVLYMAMPSPDGRGQVLQPVQMMQLPGKPYAYVVPGAATGLQGGMQPQALPDQQMMVLPPLQGNGNLPDYGLDGRNARGISNKSNYTMGIDDVNNPYVSQLVDDTYGKGNADANQFSTDPALASLYASTQRPSLESLLGQIRRLSRDQVGCRLVQQALDEEGPMAATLILQEGLPFWGEAMVDPFGNYLFQKILEKVTPEERIMLIKNVSSRLVNASLNLQGTRSVQKVVELCAQDEQDGHNVGVEESAAAVLTQALAPAAARLCIDSHGNHVIQRILLRLGPVYSQFVFDAVAASVGDVARHRHGCCVIQRCLDSPQTESRANLVRRIVEKSLELMQDAYGNYVVQYVLDVCSDDDVHAVCESVVGKANLLAIQKFSSNVMEKCLERCTDRVKEMYLLEMSDPDRVRELMMDPFGNYVIQRALSVATHSQAIRLVEAMRPHLIAAPMSGPNGARNGGVRNTAGGRRIIAKICRRFPNFTLNPVGTQDELYSQNKGNHRYLNHHQQGDPMHQLNQPRLHAAYPPIGAPMQQYAPDPRMAHIPIQPQQQQQQHQQHQLHYGLGGNVGYYDPFANGNGGYPGM